MCGLLQIRLCRVHLLSFPFPSLLAPFPSSHASARLAALMDKWTYRQLRNEGTQRRAESPSKRRRALPEPSLSSASLSPPPTDAVSPSSLKRVRLSSWRRRKQRREREKRAKMELRGDDPMDIDDFQKNPAHPPASLDSPPPPPSPLRTTKSASTKHALTREASSSSLPRWQSKHVSRVLLDRAKIFYKHSPYFGFPRTHMLNQLLPPSQTHAQSLALSVFFKVLPGV